jgi:hypothetical protein
MNDGMYDIRHSLLDFLYMCPYIPTIVQKLEFEIGASQRTIAVEFDQHF